jgi:hypothetical protein
MPTVLEAATRKARKEHCCDYCGLKIEPGEMYEDATLVYDGDLYHWKSHLSCKELTRELDMFDGCDEEGLSGEAFQEYVDNYLSDKDIWFKDWAERLTKAKEMLCKKP